jgi:archaellum component FlaF (FlaF/FlaG flagellin family)
VAVISFSVIVSCIFISLLLVTVGIIYSRMGRSINVVISILFDGENISFDASLVMYTSLVLPS